MKKINWKNIIVLLLTIAIAAASFCFAAKAEETYIVGGDTIRVVRNNDIDETIIVPLYCGVENGSAIVTLPNESGTYIITAEEVEAAYVGDKTGVTFAQCFVMIFDEFFMGGSIDYVVHFVIDDPALAELAGGFETFQQIVYYGNEMYITTGELVESDWTAVIAPVKFATIVDENGNDCGRIEVYNYSGTSEGLILNDADACEDMGSMTLNEVMPNIFGTNVNNESVNVEVTDWVIDTCATGEIILIAGVQN